MINIIFSLFTTELLPHIYLSFSGTELPCLGFCFVIDVTYRKELSKNLAYSIIPRLKDIEDAHNQHRKK